MSKEDIFSLAALSSYAKVRDQRTYQCLPDEWPKTEQNINNSNETCLYLLLKCYTTDVSLLCKCWPQSIPQAGLKKQRTNSGVCDVLNAQKSTKLSKQESHSGPAQSSKHTGTGTGLPLSSHSESFITALYDRLDGAPSVFMKQTEQCGPVRVRMFTANRAKIPISNS